MAGPALVYLAALAILGRRLPDALRLFLLTLAVANDLGTVALIGTLYSTPIHFASLIGFLMLMGLAAKNSILLVEYAIESERRGESQRAALMEACRERTRPIVMTTLAMAAGMLLTALSIGKVSEFRQPMAVAVIGGLMTSTVLSLLVVPVVYEFVDDFERWLTPYFARFVTPREAPKRPAPAE